MTSTLAALKTRREQGRPKSRAAYYRYLHRIHDGNELKGNEIDKMDEAMSQIGINDEMLQQDLETLYRHDILSVGVENYDERIAEFDKKATAAVKEIKEAQEVITRLEGVPYDCQSKQRNLTSTKFKLEEIRRENPRLFQDPLGRPVAGPAV